MTACYCGGLYRCGDCHRDVCFCVCEAEPTDAELAGHGVTVEPADYATDPSYAGMRN